MKHLLLTTISLELLAGAFMLSHSQAQLIG